MSKWLEHFVLAASDHGRHTREGGSRGTNSAYRKLHDAREAMRLESDGGRGALLALLEHQDASVRKWAALYLLPSDEDAALSVIDAIGREDGLVALGARTTAREWRAGRLKVK